MSSTSSTRSRPERSSETTPRRSDRAPPAPRRRTRSCHPRRGRQRRWRPRPTRARARRPPRSARARGVRDVIEPPPKRTDEVQERAPARMTNPVALVDGERRLDPRSGQLDRLEGHRRFDLRRSKPEPRDRAGRDHRGIRPRIGKAPAPPVQLALHPRQPPTRSAGIAATLLQQAPRRSDHAIRIPRPGATRTSARLGPRRRSASSSASAIGSRPGSAANGSPHDRERGAPACGPEGRSRSNLCEAPAPALARRSRTNPWRRLIGVGPDRPQDQRRDRLDHDLGVKALVLHEFLVERLVDQPVKRVRSDCDVDPR